ncbi:SWIM zinc finger family protein [Polaromonas vacuolata]
MVSFCTCLYFDLQFVCCHVAAALDCAAIAQKT